MRVTTAVRTAVLALALLGLAATANAEQPTVTRDLTALPIVQRDLRLADDYWLHHPQCPHVTVDLARMVPAQLGNQMVADPAAETYLNSCTIYLSNDVWAAILEHARWELCAMITHEQGHLLGLLDAPGSMTMMNPYFSFYADLDPACSWAFDRSRLRRADRPWLRAHRLSRTTT